MTVEWLYPELANLYGDIFNAKYLAACIKGASLAATCGEDEPAFAKGEADAVCIGSMTERAQAFALQRLTPYANVLKSRIEQGLVVIATGNAPDLLCESLDADGEIVPCLGVFPCRAVRRMRKRRCAFFLGDFEGMTVVGHLSRFSQITGAQDFPFLTVRGGFGCPDNPQAEGMRRKNCFATGLLGPFLPLNPPFVRFLLRTLGEPDTLFCEEEITEAYNRRVQELSTPGFTFEMKTE